MNITSRIDAYITNAALPWENKQEQHVTIGALMCFKVTKTGDFFSEWKFEQLWLRSFPVQTNVLCWEKSFKLLALGMDDGKIYCLRIAPELKYKQYEEVKIIIN